MKKYLKKVFYILSLSLVKKMLKFFFYYLFPLSSKNFEHFLNKDESIIKFVLNGKKEFQAY